MNESATVLIVGAGPTGLMMACELARYGIHFKVIDKKTERSQTTNAAVVHTRTLELFENIGIVDRFLKIGRECKAFRIHGLKGEELAEIPLDQGDSHFKFSLLIPQWETERILTERLEELGSHIERGEELIEVVLNDRKIISTVKLLDGKLKQIESEWVIGCDGIHSLVREKSHISFLGKDLPQQFLVGDLRLETKLSQDKADGFFGIKQILACFPLQDNVYRVVANLNQENGRDLSEEDMKKIVQNRSQGLFRVTSILQIAPFWIHSKIVERMQKDSFFIAGDAAHVHSPAGGQGMNTGIQDAYNLAWKLALVIKGHAQPSLLESYQAERYPVIKEIVSKTEKLTELALLGNDLLFKLRTFVFRNMIGKSQFLKRKLGSLVTQLSIRYKKSPIIDYRTNLNGRAPRPGERAPDHFIESSGLRLYDCLCNSKHNLLLFTGKTINAADWDLLKEVLSEIDQNYSNTINSLVISFMPFPGATNIIIDSHLSLHKCYGMSRSGVCLIRPDQYIAFIQSLDKVKIRSFLNEYPIIS